ncbi:MAG: DUF485 domain-containing protein [Verrucomicrobia bacterium]|nr:DUF485 domain-containing protein [Verrucomicrobiota bacterium]
MKSKVPPTSSAWNSIAQLPQYKALLRSKKAFIVPASVFFIVYYFALPILVGWWPELMKKPLLGPVNAAYLFALSQFFMAWTIAYIYVQKAAQWDEQARQILSQTAAEPANK